MPYMLPSLVAFRPVWNGTIWTHLCFNISVKINISLHFEGQMDVVYNLEWGKLEAFLSEIFWRTV
uniref:Uncharacterized protein n=1 Tax=Cannabis sativa TaxID=3483 RepID=A0A803QWH0_CANSA